MKHIESGHWDGDTMYYTRALCGRVVLIDSVFEQRQVVPSSDWCGDCLAADNRRTQARARLAAAGI